MEPEEEESVPVGAASTEPVDIDLYLRGLCLPVLDEQRRDLSVLLPDARTRQWASDGALLSPHVACLEYDPKQWDLFQADVWRTLPLDVNYLTTAVAFGDACVCCCDVPHVADKCETERRIILLGHDDLRIDATPIGSHSDEIAVDEATLPFLLFEKCTGPGVAIDTGLFGQHPDARVLARFHARSGTVRGYLDKFDDEQTTLGPLTGTRRVETLPGSQLAQGAVLRSTVEGKEPVRLVAIDRRSGAVLWALRLRNAASAPDDDNRKLVKLDLWNMELATILRQDKPATDVEPVPDRDFEIYYRLCAAAPSDPVVPFVSSGGAGSSTAKCMHPMAKKVG